MNNQFFQKNIKNIYYAVKTDFLIAEKNLKYLFGLDLNVWGWDGQSEQNFRN